MENGELHVAVSIHETHCIQSALTCDHLHYCTVLTTVICMSVVSINRHMTLYTREGI